MDQPETSATCARRPRFHTAILLISLLIVGCVDDEDAATSLEMDAVVLQPDLRIDGYAADLVPISWLGASSRGTIAVTQLQDASIRFFDEHGNDLGAVGRSGEGPGEFRWPVRGGWLADTLWISDLELNRITLIAPDLHVIRTLPPLTAATPRPEDRETLPTFTFVFPYAFYSDNEVLAGAMGSAGDPLAEAFEGLALIRVDSSGQVKRLILETPENEGSMSVRFEGGVGSVSVPFFPHPHWAISPDGARIATVRTTISGPAGGSFSVSLYDAVDGSEIFNREYPIAGVPIPQHELDSAVSAYRERLSHPAMRRVFENEAKDRILPVYAPVTDLFVSMDHRVWLGLRTSEDQAPWLVLDTAGEPVERLFVQGNVTLRAANGTNAWGVERDEVGVESVVRYTLPEREEVAPVQR